MMQEILALLRSSGENEGETASDDSSPGEMALHVEPLPFPPASDRIREPTPEEYAELKKKLRTKLSSRRYSRRRKARTLQYHPLLLDRPRSLTTADVCAQDETKAQAVRLGEYQKERSRLHAISAYAVDASIAHEERRRDTERLRTELATLKCEANSTAGHTFALYEQAERMVHPHPHRGLAEHAVRPDHLSDLRPVHGDWSQADQLSRAITNLRTIVAVLSDRQRDGSPDFALSIYNGWRVVECKRRGARFCLQASKQLARVSRPALSERVWANADDQHKRVMMCGYFTRFFVTTTKRTPLDGTSCVFYSEELHEFPPPFRCRAFSSIHGVHSDGDGAWYYVKHSVHGRSPKLDGRRGDEIVGVILQDAADGVRVDLVLLYDTHSVCHAEQITCEEPPVSHRVLSQWERHHHIRSE